MNQPDYMMVLSAVMHQFRASTKNIAYHANELSVATRGEIDVANVQYRTQQIIEAVPVISSQLALVDLYLAPQQLGQVDEISLHNLFFKTIQHLRLKQKEKKVQIILSGDGRFNIHANNIVENIPYILFDNAIKYSPPSMNVDVLIYEDMVTDSILVCVSSMGPKLGEGESPSVTKLNFRGTYARATMLPGQGIGLFILDSICKNQGIQLSISSEGGESIINEIPYRLFKVKMCFRSASQSLISR